MLIKHMQETMSRCMLNAYVTVLVGESEEEIDVNQKVGDMDRSIKIM